MTYSDIFRDYCETMRKRQVPHTRRRKFELCSNCWVLLVS